MQAAMNVLGVYLPPDRMRKLFKYFDQDDNNTVDALEFCHVVFPSMSENEFDLSSLSSPKRVVDEDGEETPRHGGEELAAALPSHEYLTFTSESERRRRMELQKKLPSTAFECGEWVKRAGSRSKVAPVTSTSSESTHANEAAQVTWNDTEESGHMRPCLSRTNTPTLKQSDANTADLATELSDGTSVDELSREARKSSFHLRTSGMELHIHTLLEELQSNMDSRMDQIESKVKRESANVRRDIEANSETLRAISKRLGAPTAGRLTVAATSGSQPKGPQRLAKVGRMVASFD